MEPTEPNAGQIAYWNEITGGKWVAQADTLDAVLTPFSTRTIDRLDVRDGERVLDVGCGCGATTLALAKRVGPTGTVIGLDISKPMLACARERAAAAGCTQIDLQLADAQTHAFADATVDALFSRFGVMFFDDPTRAFANLRSGMRSGGRLGFACWQALTSNQWMSLPLMAASTVLTLPVPPPNAPGPFAFADRERVQSILQDAGWTDVQIESYAPELQISKSPDLHDAVEFLLQLGPVGSALRDADATIAEHVRNAVHTAIGPYHGPDGVRMASAAWIVSARNP